VEVDWAAVLVLSPGLVLQTGSVGFSWASLGKAFAEMAIFCLQLHSLQSRSCQGWCEMEL
jgi:hypothetical protein